MSEVTDLKDMPPSIGLEPTGLRIINPDMDFEEWEAIGQQLQAMQKCLRWWVGDWINFGESRYGETYVQAIDATERSYQWLADSKWVCSKIEPSDRRTGLTFAHHQEALAATKFDGDPLEVLAWAEENERSSRDVREYVKAMQPPREEAAPKIIPDIIYVTDDGKWTENHLAEGALRFKRDEV